MRKQFSVLTVLLALSLFGVYVPAAHASARESALFVVSGLTVDAQHWISLLTPDFSACLGGTIDYPKNTVFFVSHGWADFPFSKDPMKPAFMSPATTFAFMIDGQIQQQTRVYQNNFFGIPDFMVKLFNTEYDGGLTGSHLFTGLFYLDASNFGGTFGIPVLQFECDTTVNFTG